MEDVEGKTPHSRPKGMQFLGFPYDLKNYKYQLILECGWQQLHSRQLKNNVEFI